MTDELWTPEAKARYHAEMQRLRAVGGSSVSDHADTIRRYISHDVRPGPSEDEALAALDALLAERRQAIDALREISQARSFRGPSVMGETVEGLAGFARAALVKLGEKP